MYCITSGISSSGLIDHTAAVSILLLLTSLSFFRTSAQHYPFFTPDFTPTLPRQAMTLFSVHQESYTWVLSCQLSVCGAAIAQVLGAGPDPEPPQRSPELALALASGYQHDPEQLLDMQQALFDASESEGLVGKHRSKSSGPEPGLPIISKTRLSCLVASCAVK